MILAEVAVLLDDFDEGMNLVGSLTRIQYRCSVAE